MAAVNCLLLDRDGVLIEERNYDYTPGSIRLLPGVVEGLRKLRGWRFFVVSNQSGIGRGLLTASSVEACHARLREMLRAEGIELTDIAYCPHCPEDGCSCRKPRLGMWEELSRRNGLRPEDCVMAGNQDCDVAFARAVGCMAVLVDDGTGHGMIERPDVCVSSLPELADALLHTYRHRVMTMEGAAALAERMRAEGKRIVTTNGAFDLLHAGHRFFLEEARKRGDVLMIGVNSDNAVRLAKGPDRPVESEGIRALKVARYADAVFVFDDPDPRPWLRRIRPDIHVNAETYGQECIEAPVLREIGAELLLVPVKPELGSTTELLLR